MIATKLTCKKHRRYQALRPPRADCPACRAMFKDAERARGAKLSAKEGLRTRL